MQRTKYLIQKLKKLREMHELAEASKDQDKVLSVKEQMKSADEEY